MKLIKSSSRCVKSKSKASGNDFLPVIIVVVVVVDIGIDRTVDVLCHKMGKTVFAFDMFRLASWPIKLPITITPNPSIFIENARTVIDTT